MSNVPLLSVRDLSVAFTQNGKTSLAVDRISFDIEQGETVALVGESGSGKSVTALSVLKLLAYPAASHPSGQILFGGRDLLSAKEDELRAVRGNDVTMIFQEPMTSLNPLHVIEDQIGEVLKLHQGMSTQGRARTHAGTPRPGRHPRCGKAARSLSAPAVRRPAAARHDRHGACQPAEASDRRRADDGAGCDRAGADFGASRGPESQGRHVASVHHA